MHEEFARIKQLLVNNGYRNRDNNQEVKHQLDQLYGENSPPDPEKATHHLYYRNFMNTEYRTDERTLNHIVNKQITCKDASHSLKLHIYYQMLCSVRIVDTTALVRVYSQKIGRSETRSHTPLPLRHIFSVALL